MKKLFALLLTCVMLLSLAACGARDLDAPAGYKQASSDEYCDYVLYVPSAWNTESVKSNLTTASVPVGDSRVTVGVARLEARYDIDKNADGNVSVDEYWESCKADYAYLTKHTLDDAKGEKVTLGSAWGKDGKTSTGFRYTFAGEYRGTSYSFAQVFALNGGDLYCITLTVKTAHYTDDTIKMFGDILSYFQFK